jgi:tRNA(fMet)-specific endonuclease VapC
VYVFDTDVLSLLMKGRLPSGARARLDRVPQSRAMTTSVTLGELVYGAVRSSKPSHWLEAIAVVVDRLECLPFDAPAARRYGELRAHLEGRGRRLDDPDLRIASICSSRDLVLVSGNARHFARVPDLRFENWLR